MSNLDYFGAPAGATTLAAPPTPPPGPGRRRRVLLIGLLPAVAALVVGLVVLRPGPRDDHPVVLPDTLAGLPAAETAYQFGESTGWRTTMAEVFGDRPIDGRAYGSIRSESPYVNVVVRADSRREADLGLGRPPYTAIGEVSCTNTFQFQLPDQEQTEPVRRDGMLLCWRARGTLTVSLLVLARGEGYEQTAARAVDDVWALQS